MMVSPTRPLLVAAVSSLFLACAGAEPPPANPPAPPPETAAPAPEPAPPPAPPAPPVGETGQMAPAPPPPPPKPAAPPEDDKKLPGANLTMGSVTANGVEMKDVSCKIEGALGLLGALVLTAGLGERKARIDACGGGKRHETTIVWTAAGGKVAKIKAEGPDAKVNACIEKAVAGAKAPMPAMCKATIISGK